ncbi:hypothetical protein D3C84_702280 [compost metagenome]
MQCRPAYFRQPRQQRLWIALLQRQGNAAKGQQHSKPRNHVLEQVGALLPRREQPVEQRQQQATEVEHHGGVLTDLAEITVVIGLGVEQKVGDVHRDHQKQFTLTAVNRAVRTTEQQHQGRQHVEQRSEEDVEILDVGSCKPRK